MQYDTPAQFETEYEANRYRNVAMRAGFMAARTAPTNDGYGARLSRLYSAQFGSGNELKNRAVDLLLAA